MMKTAGTNLNGQLAMQFERVCGHKGYSYDAYQTNERYQQYKNKVERENMTHIKSWQFKTVDTYSNIPYYEKFNRGRVHHGIMDEIGYENCDWVSVERSWMFWKMHESFHDVSLELHVPCREPIDHLMSFCNHRKIHWDCVPISSEKEERNQQNVIIRKEIYRCMEGLERFSEMLTTEIKNTHVKCYDYNVQSTQYMEYMSSKLERKRIQADYSYRPTNKKRQKDQECIWRDHEHRNFVRNYLLDSYEYFQFCGKCIGSINDLFRNHAGIS